MDSTDSAKEDNKSDEFGTEIFNLHLTNKICRMLDSFVKSGSDKKYLAITPSMKNLIYNNMKISRLKSRSVVIVNLDPESMQNFADESEAPLIFLVPAEELVL